MTVKTGKVEFLRVSCRDGKYGAYCQHFHTPDLLAVIFSYLWMYLPLLFGLGLRSFFDVVF